MAHLNDELNLVIEVARESGPVYVHHTPIRLEVFEHHFRLLAATHADMWGRGGSYANLAPRIAALTLRDVGKKEAAHSGNPDGDGGASLLLGEIKRQSVVIAPASGAWGITNVDVAISRDALAKDEWSEVESAIVFFTCAVWMTSRTRAKEIATVVASGMGLSSTSLNAEDWMRSLPTSTSAEATHPKPGMSQVPS